MHNVNWCLYFKGTDPFFQRRLPGKGRMRWHEEHRKAVYGKTVCTVWWGRVGVACPLLYPIPIIPLISGLCLATKPTFIIPLISGLCLGPTKPTLAITLKCKLKNWPQALELTPSPWTDPKPFRKLSFGHRTKQGAKRFSILMTVLETCRLKGDDLPQFIRTAITTPTDKILPLVNATLNTSWIYSRCKKSRPLGSLTVTPSPARILFLRHRWCQNLFYSCPNRKTLFQ